MKRYLAVQSDFTDDAIFNLLQGALDRYVGGAELTKDINGAVFDAGMQPSCKRYLKITVEDV